MGGLKARGARPGQEPDPYDLESRDPQTGQHVFLEVKGGSRIPILMYLHRYAVRETESFEGLERRFTAAALSSPRTTAWFAGVKFDPDNKYRSLEHRCFRVEGGSLIRGQS
jgi:hypothetical protein